MTLGRTWLCLAAAACVTSAAPAQTVAFHEDFESGLAKWATTSMWHLELSSAPCGSQAAPFPSGDACARFGQNWQNYCNFDGFPDGTLTMLLPTHIPASATSARLSYATYEHTECGNLGNCGWDERYVYISNDGGQAWTQIAEGGPEQVWLTNSVDLSDYIGDDVLIRFRFDAIDDLANDYLGWLVDDVTIEYDAATPYCTGKVNSQGCTPTLSYTGRPGVTEVNDPFTVTATNLINNTGSKLVCAHTPNAAPFHGGVLCVSPPAARTTVRSSGGSPIGVVDCSGVYTFEFTPTFYAQKSYLAGETMFIQFTGRDPGYAPPGNHSLSAGIWVTLQP